MKMYEIDTIVKGELLRHGLSIHHYVKKAYLALQFLRSINFDSAYFIKVTTLTFINGKATLPSDFVGVVRIGYANGQYLERLSANDQLVGEASTITGDYGDDYGDDYFTGTDSAYGALVTGGGWWYPNTNKYGENLGGYFGYSNVSEKSYKLLLQENKIYVNENMVDETIIMEYMTDGLSQLPYEDEEAVPIIYIHPYAVDAMKAYIDWMESQDGNRFVNKELKSQYYNELRKYRARMFSIDADQIRRSLRRAYYASPKN